MHFYICIVMSVMVALIKIQLNPRLEMSKRAEFR